ncbi:MAG: hypothetical protein ACOC80_16325 [Petrotogales bacterium]
MGACYVGKFVDTDSEAELKETFNDDQEIDRYENGHMYSGGIGMAEGLDIRRDRSFGSVSEARLWVDDHAQKWGPAIAVRVEGPNECGWYYGAICAE